uniref:Putative MFS-type transporter n=1 Tax=Talaromyces marneffei PM1 TaxID=1077442 RepID=A0A093VDF7_TALMA
MADIALSDIPVTRTSASKAHYQNAVSESAYQSDKDINLLSADRPTTTASLSSSTSDHADISVWRLANIVLAVSGITFLGSFTTGLLTIGLPQTAQDIGLSEDLILWPSSVYSIWSLPADRRDASGKINLARLRTEIDWIGGIISCACLAMLSYILAALTNDVNNIKTPGNIAMLVICVLLMPVFILWEQRQERLGKPALIPNSLWRNSVFTNVCLMVMFSWAVINVMELYCSLFFQKIQGLSAFQASLRILPNVVIGSICQLTTGLLVHRISAFYLVVGSTLLSAGAPLLMAVIKVEWPYWYDAFFAQALSPISADILFTVALLVISDVFPQRTQALAGAVFNTVSQFGNSLGLTVMAVISSVTTKHAAASPADYESPGPLLAGYRAGFWAAFAWMMCAFCIGGYGLRKIGKVGLKRD